jgi:hypothetical protein
MKYILTGLFLVMSLLLLSEETPAKDHQDPQSALQQTPIPAANSPQVQDIRDIKGPVPLPDMNRFLIPVITIIALLIIAVLIFFFLKRRRRPEMVASPPDAIALAELDRAKILMEQPLVYAERISVILRQYIEARFQIRFTRQTTREFFSHLRNGTTIAEADITTHAGDLQECLEQCDMAKFAHSTPDHDNMMRMDQAVRTFIETTRQKQQPVA